jgi:hypothetical protein
VLRTIMRPEETAETVDSLSLSLATLAVVRAVASARPLLLAVDDAQWLDRPPPAPSPSWYVAWPGAPPGSPWSAVLVLSHRLGSEIDPPRATT